MRKLQMILQILFGLIFLVFGLNKFIGFISIPPSNQLVTNYMTSLGSLQYMFPVLGVVEILCGLSLMVNRYVTLSLLMLVPITFNILGFHLFLDPSGVLVPLIMTTIHIYLIYDRKNRYMDLIKK